MILFFKLLIDSKISAAKDHSKNFQCELASFFRVIVHFRDILAWLHVRLNTSTVTNVGTWGPLSLNWIWGTFKGRGKVLQEF